MQKVKVFPVKGQGDAGVNEATYTLILNDEMRNRPIGTLLWEEPPPTPNTEQHRCPQWMEWTTITKKK